ncbi:MAG: hypothetical protein JWO31_2152 [Phycisphaerales bacterium]|nr:hypothetical protein [Phycisphaerales bacterium]
MSQRLGPTHPPSTSRPETRITGCKPVPRGRLAAVAVAALSAAIVALAPVARGAPAGAPTTRPATRPSAGVAAALPPAAAAGDPAAFLLHPPGIAGEAGIDRSLVGGLRDGGFGGQAEIYDWTGENKGIAALVNRARNDRQAQVIADKVVAHRRAHPADPILLTAHSGGTGLAVFALEKLPKDVTVDGLLLLSPALSPGYDLSPALAHVTGRAYVFSSTMDAFVLGFGTTLFGTIDRKAGESAGRVGFAKPADAVDPAQYDKLVPCPYQKAWLAFGNLGDHVSVMSRTFSRQVLTPLILSHLPGGGGPLPGPFLPNVAATGTRPAATAPAASP